MRIEKPLAWIKWLVCGLVALRFVSQIAVVPVMVHVETHPARYTAGDASPADFGLDYRDVTLTGSDGVPLRGWYIPSQNGAVVMLLHGYIGHRGTVLAQAAALARHGYGVLLYDLRAHGESGGDLVTFGWQDVNDVTTAVHFLQDQADVDETRIGIFGFSLGGQIAIRAAAQMDEIEAVVVDDPGFAQPRDMPPPVTLGERWQGWQDLYWFKCLEWQTGLSAPDAVIDVIGGIAPRPILFISTGAQGGPGQRMIQHFYEHAAEPKALYRIPEAEHGTSWSARPQEYEREMVTFFDRALLGE